MYKVVFSPKAVKQLKGIEQRQHRKLQSLLDDILENPFVGIGKPESLKHMDVLSRRIDKKNRLIYTVTDDTIEIISISGHYEDH